MSADQQTTEAAISKRNSWILWGAAYIGVIFLIEGVLRAVGHGGFFSFVSAMLAAHARRPSIDIDENALRFPIMCVTGLVVFLVSARLQINMDKRWKSGLVLIAIMGSGFLIDGLYGGRLIGQVMASQGYSYCPSRDHHEGAGKGKVWFKSYVVNPATCPPAQSTTPSVPLE